MARNWDDAKNLINQRRHRVSFETAWLVFEEDPEAVTFKDFIDDNGEMRYQTIGLVEGRLLFIAHVIRLIEGNEEPWLISARKADKYEKKAYFRSRQG